MPERQQDWLRYFDADTVARLAHIGINPSGLVEGNLIGNHRSPFHGFAVEFAGHRGYVPGDDIKHIDWKVYYKSERYMVKTYEQETNFLCHMVVDISESMTFEHEHGRKLDYAAFIATAISYVVVNQSDSVGAIFFDDDIRSTVRVSNQEDVVSRISREMIAADPKQSTSLGDVLSLVAEQIGRRRVVFVVSDFFGDLEHTFDGIKRLLDDNHEIILLQVVDPLELSFDIPGRVRLLELEGERKLDLVGRDIQASYEACFHEFLDAFKARAMSLGIDYILCDMSRAFGFHLAEYLSLRTMR